MKLHKHTFRSHDNCPLVAETDLANGGVVAVGADVVGGELSVAANTPHVLETVAAIAGLSIPLAPETLGRPVGVRRATIGVGSNAGTTIAIAGLSLPLAEALGRPVGERRTSVGVGSNATAISVAITGLSFPLAKTLGRPVGVRGTSIGVGSNATAISVAITGLSLPLAKTAKTGLIDISTIAISGNSIGGELTIITIDAGHSLVAATITIAGFSLPLAEALGRPVGVRRTSIRVGSNAAAISVAIARLSLPLAKTLRRPVGVGGASIGVGSDTRTTITITGLSIPLAKAAKAGLINVASITICADSIGGELAIIAIDAGHSLVAATIAVAGLGLPLAKTLGRPVGVGIAARVGSNAAAVAAVVGWVGVGASREGEDEDLKHSTFTLQTLCFCHRLCKNHLQSWPP